MRGASRTTREPHPYPRACATHAKDTSGGSIPLRPSYYDHQTRGRIRQV